METTEIITNQGGDLPLERGNNMDIKRLKIDLDEIILEIKEEHQECHGKDIEKFQSFINDWDSIIKEYRIVASEMLKYATTSEEKDIFEKCQNELHYVRCFGKTREEDNIEYQKSIDSEDYTDINS